MGTLKELPLTTFGFGCLGESVEGFSEGVFVSSGNSRFSSSIDESGFNSEVSSGFSSSGFSSKLEVGFSSSSGNCVLKVGCSCVSGLIAIEGDVLRLVYVADRCWG